MNYFSVAIMAILLVGCANQPSDRVKLNDIYFKSDTQICIKYDAVQYSDVGSSGSMRPTIADSSVLIYTDNVKDIRVGDIVVVSRADGREVVHRVHQITGDEYILKGDNNVFPDAISVKKQEITRLVIGVLY